jgi:hypothetical protein
VKKGVGRIRKSNRGSELIKVHYMYVWKYHNETPNILIVFKKEREKKEGRKEGRGRALLNGLGFYPQHGKKSTIFFFFFCARDRTQGFVNARRTLPLSCLSSLSLIVQMRKRRAREKSDLPVSGRSWNLNPRHLIPESVLTCQLKVLNTAKWESWLGISRASKSQCGNCCHPGLRMVRVFVVGSAYLVMLFPGAMSCIHIFCFIPDVGNVSPTSCLLWQVWRKGLEFPLSKRE